MVSQVISPITFGMAGVIRTGTRTSSADDMPGLSAAFRTVPQTARTEWRGEGMTVLTVQHANEAHVGPGSRARRIATAGALQGVVSGTFFGTGTGVVDADDLNRRVLAAFQANGRTSFRALNGAWVGAFWDAEAQRALFVRDATGQQALYVARLQDRIVFSTDLRAFQAVGLQPALDEQSLAEFLHYLYVPAPRTILAGCHAVLPGHVLVAGQTIEQQRYSPPRFVRGEPLPEADVDRAIEDQLPAFEERLLAAVADCVPPTGRVAVTLSGGKDSSTVAVALSKICPERVVALTVGQKDQALDEADHAALVCRSLGFEHRTYLPTDEELAAGIYTFAHQHDQPIGDPAALPYFLGMASLPEDCTVILDGSANDYYFGLPHAIKGLLYYQRRVEVQRVVPGFLWPLMLRLMAIGPSGLSRLSDQWRRPIEESWVAWEGWSASELAGLFGRPISFEDTYLWRKMREGENSDWLSLITDVVFGVWQPHTDFRKSIDLAHSIGRGIRLPFADDRIAAFVNGLPEQLKFRGNTNKTLLRAYMARNLPREIVEKPKRGFIFDLNRVLQNPIHSWVDELNRQGLLKVLPSWPDRPIQDLLTHHREDPQNPGWQQRLYALCLLATVVANIRGNVPAPTVQENV